jgi:hypothetical protein
MPVARIAGRVGLQLAVERGVVALVMRFGAQVDLVRVAFVAEEQHLAAVDHQHERTIGNGHGTSSCVEERTDGVGEGCGSARLVTAIRGCVRSLLPTPGSTGLSSSCSPVFAPSSGAISPSFSTRPRPRPLVDLGDADDMLAFGSTRKMVTPCVLRPAMRMSPTVVRIILPWSVDQHDLLARLDREARDHAAVAFRGVDVGDALAAAVGAAIFVGAGALAEAVLGDGEDELLRSAISACARAIEGAFGALAVAPRRAAQIGFALLLRGAGAAQDRHGDDLVVAEQADAAHAGRVRDWNSRRRST